MGKLGNALRGVALSAIISGLVAFAFIGNVQADTFAATAYESYGFVAFPSGHYDASRIAAEFQAIEPLAYPGYNFQRASLNPFEAPPRSRLRTSEPFSVTTLALMQGAIVSKWDRVKRRLSRERKVLAHCHADVASCPAAAKSFLSIIDKAPVDKGWARIREINRSINLDIRPVSDMAQYGVVDLWVTPLMLFTSHAGDCEDYAIAKYVALQEIGVADRNLRLVVVHDRTAGEDHMVTAVRHDGQWLILDNRTLAIRQDAALPELKPLFIIDRKGVRRVAAPPTSVAAIQ